MLALVHPFDPSPEPHSSRQLPRRLPSFSKKSISFASKNHAVSHQPSPSHPTSVPQQHHHQHHQEPSPSPASASSSPVQPQPTPPASVDINSYPSTDLLKVLASLLTQIAAANDKLESSSSPTSENQSSYSIQHVTPIWRTLTTASKNAILTPSSTLTFHARNVPTITLEAYLLRILKYCPTSNQVFLSLLVYFDRMSKLSTEAVGKTFVIDSFNIHRLVIAGVTVASKFFSDVFYTNSRYAKVGGLPQAELNQLELQFLLLNDFRLVISPAEMQRYAEQLIVFANSDNPPTMPLPSHPLPSTTTTATPPTPSSTHMSRTPQGAAAMGAIDAYGGRIPDENHTYTHSQPELHRPSQQQHSSYQYHSTPSSSRNLPQYASSSNVTFSSAGGHNKTPSFRATAQPPIQYHRYADDTETETETETDVADGDDTTDDEPTIRPTRSSAGGSCTSSDTQSLCSVSTDEGDTGDEGGDEYGGEDEWIAQRKAGLITAQTDHRSGGGSNDGGGDATPERRLFIVQRSPKDRDIVDHRMNSP